MAIVWKLYGDTDILGQKYIGPVTTETVSTSDVRLDTFSSINIHYCGSHRSSTESCFRELFRYTHSWQICLRILFKSTYLSILVAVTGEVGAHNKIVVPSSTR